MSRSEVLGCLCSISRAADVGPTADAPSTLLDSSKETYHGTRAVVLCILRDGLRSSLFKATTSRGAWLTEDLEGGISLGAYAATDEFPGYRRRSRGCTPKRTNRQRPEQSWKRWPKDMEADAELKAVHLQMASEDWVAFVKDFCTAIWRWRF